MARLNILFVGRLESDTEVSEFLKWLHGQGNYKVDFIGDGRLKNLCEDYGEVHGYIDPARFYKKADLCIPGGYLSYIEAKKYNCRIKVFATNRLKKDYWSAIQKIKAFPSWEKIADEYISLYNGTK